METEEKLIWIEKIAVKGKKYLVYVKGEETPYIFTEDDIINHRIMKNASFYQKEWEKILSSQKTGILFDKVLKYIDYQPRTESEIRIYLISLDTNKTVADEIVNKLKKMQFIDDARYTKNYIESALRHKTGPLVIKKNLMAKGISENIIDELLQTCNDDELVLAAKEIINKSLKIMPGLPVIKQKENLYNKLLRSGYDYSVIKLAMADVKFKEVDYNILEEEYNKLIIKENDQNKIINRLMSKGYTYQEINQIIKK